MDCLRLRLIKCHQSSAQLVNSINIVMLNGTSSVWSYVQTSYSLPLQYDPLDKELLVDRFLKKIVNSINHYDNRNIQL